MFPQKIHSSIHTYEYDLIKNRVLTDVNQVKIRSYWIRGSLKPMTGVLMTRETFGHRHTQEECHVMTGAEIGDMYFVTKELQGLMAATRGWVGGVKQTLPQSSQENKNGSETSISISSHWNC